jgi:hypothetical protein
MVLMIRATASGPRAARSLCQRGVGYDYDAVKIFMPAKAKKPIYAPYVEHVPPDPTSAIFWLKNGDPEHWRDDIERILGAAIARMLALELAMSLLLGLGLFQRDDLRLGQHQAFLGALGFQRCAFAPAGMKIFTAS